MATFNGYFDASGTEADDDVLVTAGAITDFVDWEEFDRQWLAEMSTHDVKHFHMKDFAHFKKGFSHGWSGKENEEKRKEFLGKLITLTNESVRKLFVSTLVLADYKDVDRRYLATESFGGPYALTQANCIIRAVAWLTEYAKPDDGARFFVESGDTGQDAFTRLMRHTIGVSADDVTLLSKYNSDGEDITPFHIVDFVAYEYHSEHRAVATTGAPKAKPRGALSEIRQTIYPDVGVLTRETMERMCEIASIPLRQL